VLERRLNKTQRRSSMMKSALLHFNFGTKTSLPSDFDHLLHFRVKKTIDKQKELNNCPESGLGVVSDEVHFIVETLHYFKT